MFNVTGGEVMIILVLALVVLGPEKLPDMIRKAGRLYGEVRRMANGFQSEIRDAFDEPTRELRETAELARNAMTGAVTDMTSVVQNTFRDPASGNPASGEPAAGEPAAISGGLNMPREAPRPPELVPAPGELAAAAAAAAAVNSEPVTPATVTGAPVPMAPPATGAIAAALPTPLPPPPPPPPPAPGATIVAPLASPLPPPAAAASTNGDRH